ncbi:MAG: hypothetical protein ABI977_30300 [Acidobacteriota bacterium]
MPAIDKYLFPQSSIFFSVPTYPFRKNVLSHFSLYFSQMIYCRFPADINSAMPNLTAVMPTACLEEKHSANLNQLKHERRHGKICCHGQEKGAVMNTKLHALRNQWILLGIMLSLAGLSFAGWGVGASQSSANTENGGDQNGLASVLSPDGSLKPGVNGSFNASGYRMETAASGPPRFVPTAAQSVCNGWDAQFGLSNGTNTSVSAVVVSGGDIYIGGTFVAAGNVAANRVAKFNLTTGNWSALGTGGGNGVDGFVNAMVVIGSDLYVGGDFTMANFGGTSISARGVAKFNMLTNVWSALGTGSGKGVNGRSFVLAAIGSDLYVGGDFTMANFGGTSISANRLAKFNTATNTWSALGTGSGNGVNDYVNAMAVIGSDLYVGGTFNTANVGGATVSVNYVARFNTITNTWNTLGIGGGNGVNIAVSALAVIGNDLYVGGFFQTVNVGGMTVSVNNVAKFNTTTGVWSALGTGGDNGVDGQVFALAVIGNDLYVGGTFTMASVGGGTHRREKYGEVQYGDWCLEHDRDQRW